MRLPLAAVLAVLVFAAGCGGGDDDTSSTPSAPSSAPPIINSIPSPDAAQAISLEGRLTAAAPNIRPEKAVC